MQVLAAATVTAAGGARAAKARPSAPSARPAADDPATRELRAQARDTRTGRTWDPDAPLSEGRNAHHSNTPEELRAALDDDVNWLEGDLRVNDAGVPVMSHDADAEASGLTLDQWLDVGAESRRGMKVDVKEMEALPQLLDALEASGIPDGRLMINVQTSELSRTELHELRERFPDAWIALNPSTNDAGRYDSESLAPTIDAADEIGGRVAFPIRWDIASDEAIEALESHGDVSIWTSASEGTPDDTAAEVRALRERGVQGVIDLGAPSGLLDKLLQRGKDLWTSGPISDARNAVTGGIDLARDGLDLAREGASHLPVVGGLFD